MIDMHTVNQRDIRRILALVSPMRARGTAKVRVGTAHDGGYIMLDHLRHIQVCYSIGVGSDAFWELAMAERGARVHLYDSLIERPPLNHSNFFFSQIAVGGVDDDSRAVRRLDTLLAANGHAGEKRMILKMDVEGHEWATFDAIGSYTLAQFDQIVVELHGLGLLEDPARHAQAYRVLSKLSSTHQAVHVHGNNHANWELVCGLPVPDVLEVTFAHREQFSFEEEYSLFPTDLDAPNKPTSPDFFLGRFQF